MQKTGFFISLLVVFLLSTRSVTSYQAPEMPHPRPVVASADPVSFNFDSTTIAGIDHYFSKQHKSGRLNGTVLVAKAGKVFSQAYGYTTLRGRNREPLQVNTAFQLASVSKPITAIAVLQLVEEGKLQLHEDIRSYLPDFPYEGITVHLMLSHRSGLPNYLYLTDHHWPASEQPMVMQEAYDILTHNPPGRYFRPNRRFDYSNTNYFLLAYLVEQVSGQSFGSFLKENIFEPAGMKDAFVLDCAGYMSIPNTACGTDEYGRLMKQDYYLNTIYGDKSIFASVEDLYMLDRALRDGLLLSPTLQALAYKPLNRWDGAARSYGYGWRLMKQPGGGKIAFHTGWWQGFRTYFIRHLDEDATVIVLTNTLRGGGLGVWELLDLIPLEVAGFREMMAVGSENIPAEG